MQVLLGGYRVDINGENCPSAASPLQIAVERKDLELVKILKNAGADAELARLTVATKLQHLKRHSGSSPGAASSSHTDVSPSNGYLRTPEQAVPARMSYASPSSPSDQTPSAEPKGKRSAPSSPFQLPQASSAAEITASPEEDVKGKRSLWPPPTPGPPTRAGVPPSGDKRSLSRHARQGSNENLYGGKLERRDSDLKLDNHESSSEVPRRFGHERRDSSEDLRRANQNMGRLASSRSTDLLLAQV